MLNLLLPLVLLITSILAAGETRAQTPDVFRATLSGMLEGAEHPFLLNPALNQEQPLLLEVYRRRDYRPMWIDKGAPTRQALELLQVLRAADNQGLRAADYEGSLIAYQLIDLVTDRGERSDRWAQIDLALSVTALRFIRHLHYGRVDPATAGFNLGTPRDDVDLAAALEQLGTGADVAAVIAGLEPHFHHYQLLKQWLQRYRLLAIERGLTELPALQARSVKPGEAYAGAPQLRRLLRALGDLTDTDANDGERLDAALVAAIASFQERHGLTPDGTLGKQTFEALTTPLSQRVLQIELTLERWRWLPALETPPIIVNIPQYRLFAFGSTDDREADILQMNVIVGQTYPHTRTPVFIEDMKYLVLRPYWDVPYSITAREMLPQVRANAHYLDRQNLEIVNGQGDHAAPVPPTPENIAALASGRFRLRQRPGEDNALGLVKFMLPNAYNVYLHSTPAHGLFRQSRRAFSHGCIRVSDPVALAEYVLRDTPGDWNREKIQAAMKDPKNNQRINLPKPVRVMILYGTAMATEAGRILFFDDIYGHDRKLEGLLGMAATPDTG